MTRVRAIGLPWALAGGAIALSLLGLAVILLSGGASVTASRWIGDPAMLLAAGACVVRARRDGPGRTAWGLIAAGIGCWVAGDAYFFTVLAAQDEVPIPSPADAGYLLFVPLVAAGLVLLLRRHVRPFPLERVADVAVGGMASAAFAAQFVYPEVLAAAGGATLEVLTNLAYPVADLLLLALASAAVVAVAGRPPAGWLCILGGLVAFVTADTVYLLENANEAYVAGGPLDVLWSLGACGFGLAAAVGSDRLDATARDRSSAWLIGGLGVLAIVLLVVDHHVKASTAAVYLAAGTLLTVVGRLVADLADRTRRGREAEHAARTDALTALPNRRALLADLDAFLAAPGEASRAFLLFDLDGFKKYNDSFGHHAGDLLLERLGTSLAAAAGADAIAYRLGGDEFCVLGATGEDGDALAARCREALAEHGEGWTISASCGAVQLPGEAPTSGAALQLADDRMYGEKAGRPDGAEQQASDALLATLEASAPADRAAAELVGSLTDEVGRRLGLAGEELRIAVRAGELHHVGRVAVPYAVARGGVAEGADRRVLEAQPLVSARIVGRSRALAPVAHVLRHAAEHWDGSGRPDGLAGEDIPLGSRVVAVCAAYVERVTERPLRGALSPTEATIEVLREAGTILDPRAAGLLAEVVRERARAAAAYAA